MRIIENTFDGVKTRKAVLSARIVNGLDGESEPRYLDNLKQTPYHWVDVDLLNGQGEVMQRGSAIVWDKRFQENPSRYMDGKMITPEIALSGEGAGVAQEHLSNGRFDLSALGLQLEDIQQKVVDAEAVI